MIRAASKNHADVTVIVDAEDYAPLLDELKAHNGATTLALRKRLAAKAYGRTAAYDAAISNWFAAAARRSGADLSHHRRQACRGAALRREPASIRRASIALAKHAPALRPRARRRASSSPTTTSTTPTRPMNASPSSIPSAPPPAPSSSTPIRAASRRARPSSTPIARRSPAIRCRPSAASWR